MGSEVDFSGTAATDPEQSVADQLAAVGQHPDTGGLVSEDHAQHAPGSEDDGPGPELPVVAPPD